MDNIALISDKNSYDQPVTIGIVKYQNSHSLKAITIKKIFWQWKASGETDFYVDEYVHTDVIDSTKPEDVLKYLFTKEFYG